MQVVYCEAGVLPKAQIIEEFPRLQRSWDSSMVSTYLYEPLSQGLITSALFQVDGRNFLKSSPPHSVEITNLPRQKQLSLRTQYISGLLKNIDWEKYFLTQIDTSADNLPRSCFLGKRLPLEIASALVDWNVDIKVKETLRRDGNEWERLFGRLSLIDATDQSVPGSKAFLQLSPEDVFNLLDFAGTYLTMTHKALQTNENGEIAIESLKRPDGWANIINITAMNINNTLGALSANYNEVRSYEESTEPFFPETYPVEP